MIPAPASTPAADGGFADDLTATNIPPHPRMGAQPPRDPELDHLMEQAREPKIVGPTIPMGDGGLFDFDNPEATTMTIEDYAWGLATPRWRGQTRLRGDHRPRCLYLVVQHCVMLAEAMIADGFGREDAYAGLMHESDEVVWGDPPEPVKGRFHNLKAEMKRWAAAIDARFGVTCPHPDLVKRYDLRMLVTEKRDLMPQIEGTTWPVQLTHEPFDFRIVPWSAETATDRFLSLYESLRP